MLSSNIDRDYNLIINDLNRSVVYFEENFPLADFKQADFKQHPSITLLTCADARMPADSFGYLFNRIFCVENIGNQFKTSEGSVLYGLLHLHTPLMIIAGHTDCGAIKACESDYSQETSGIRNELSIVKESLTAAQAISGLTIDESPLQYSQLAELNVDMQINYLLANKFVAGMVEKQHLLLLGVLADLHNVHGNGYGKIYTLNLNGEHKTEVLKKYRHLGRLADQALRLTEY